MKNNPQGAAAGNLTRPHPRGKGGRLSKKITLTLLGLLLVAFSDGNVLPVLGKEPPSQAASQEKELLSGPVNYDRAVQLALRQSPYFTKSSLEIEIRKLDEKDSRYDLIPPINFRTQYYINQPTISGVRNKPYSLSFTSSNYNPLESYFTLQARKIFTQMAILAHLQVISDGILKLGRMFLELEALSQSLSRQQDLLDLARRNLDYYQNRVRIGAGTSLEEKVAAQEVAGAKAEMERLVYSQKHLKERIKTFIGLKPKQTLDLDYKEARRQVTGDFKADTASLAQAQSRSYILKIAKLKRDLQAYNIMVAKARLLPSIYLGLSTADPLSTVTSRELFFSVGLEVPVWDGFKRFRNISRQKTIQRQFNVESEEKALDLADKWNETQEHLRAAVVGRNAAQAQEELARLKERQNEIRYRSGGEPLPVFLKGRKGLVEAQKELARKNLECDRAVLELRFLSGDLGANYVDAKFWQD